MGHFDNKLYSYNRYLIITYLRILIDVNVTPSSTFKQLKLLAKKKAIKVDNKSSIGSLNIYIYMDNGTMHDTDI